MECHLRAMPTSSADDRPGFHSDVPVSELIERNTRAIKASVVRSAPMVAKTEDGVTHETWLTPIEPQGTRGLEPPNPRSRDRGLTQNSSRVHRLPIEGEYVGRWVKEQRNAPEGFVDPVTSDGTEFRLNTPVNELIERIT